MLSAQPRPSGLYCLGAPLGVPGGTSRFPGHDFRGAPRCRLPAEETVSEAGETVRMKLRLARRGRVRLLSRRMACPHPAFGQRVSHQVPVRDEIALVLAPEM